MTCVYIHYTASIVLANSFSWSEYPFKIFNSTCILMQPKSCPSHVHVEYSYASSTWNLDVKFRIFSKASII